MPGAGMAVNVSRAAEGLKLGFATADMNCTREAYEKYPFARSEAPRYVRASNFNRTHHEHCHR